MRCRRKQIEFNKTYYCNIVKDKLRQGFWHLTSGLNWPHGWLLAVNQLCNNLGTTHRYRPRFQNLRHLYPDMGLKLGVFGIFSLIKITVIRQVRMNCSLNVKINMWNAAQRAKIVNAFCLHLFQCVWSAKIQIPPMGALWLMTPLHRAVGPIGVLGSPFYICGTTAGAQSCFTICPWLYELQRM